VIDITHNPASTLPQEEVGVKQFREISGLIFGSVASSPHPLLFGNNSRTHLALGRYFAEPSQSDIRITQGTAPSPVMDRH
jgi:hypothetical protein